jgi:uncharacterized OB-fold protein
VSGVTVSVCEACGWRGFPQRLWCPRCGSAALAEAAVDRGVVEVATTLRKSVGRAADANPVLGTIALDGGGRVVAALESAAPGDLVLLENDHGRIVARGM